VIVRGKKVLPSASESFKRLIDSEGKFRIPTVFVTNAGNAMRHEKAEQLSRWLEIEVYKYYTIYVLHLSSLHLINLHSSACSSSGLYIITTNFLLIPHHHFGS
jgi:ribonucleotide monophosphatase NagD (HAD superfamily)